MKDQKNRMIAAINTKRTGLLNQNICVIPNYIQNNSKKKEIIRKIDLLGKVINKHTPNNPGFNIYNDGSVEKIILIE